METFGGWDGKNRSTNCFPIFPVLTPPTCSHHRPMKIKKQNFLVRCWKFSTFNSWVNLHILKTRKERNGAEGGCKSSWRKQFEKKKSNYFSLHNFLILFSFFFRLPYNPFKVAEKHFYEKIILNFLIDTRSADRAMNAQQARISQVELFSHQIYTLKMNWQISKVSKRETNSFEDGKKCLMAFKVFLRA